MLAVVSQPLPTLSGGFFLSGPLQKRRREILVKARGVAFEVKAARGVAFELSLLFTPLHRGSSLLLDRRDSSKKNRNTQPISLYLLYRLTQAYSHFSYSIHTIPTIQTLLTIQTLPSCLTLTLFYSDSSSSFLSDSSYIDRRRFKAKGDPFTYLLA